MKHHWEPRRWKRVKGNISWQRTFHNIVKKKSYSLTSLIIHNTILPILYCQTSGCELAIDLTCLTKRSNLILSFGQRLWIVHQGYICGMLAHGFLVFLWNVTKNDAIIRASCRVNCGNAFFFLVAHLWTCEKWVREYSIIV